MQYFCTFCQTYYFTTDGYIWDLNYYAASSGFWQRLAALPQSWASYSPSTKTWRGQLCTTAQHQRHLTFTMTWNWDASTLPHPWEFFFRCNAQSSTLSEQQPKASISGQDQTVNSSTSPDWSQRQENRTRVLGISCLQWCSGHNPHWGRAPAAHAALHRCVQTSDSQLA